ncbi:MAG: murein biosynthesis integral membrane protein MurJ [Syntrophomonadaceae bacterium]|nr:murein biosynthesis integral membrane protein MurJ [Syntrophomonadaceae bacterium]
MSEGAKIAKAAGIITICMVIARILGYVRDALLYAIFGQNRITDIYNAAFSIPDFIYMILIGGALSSAFVPVFGGYLARGEDEKGWQVANTMLNLLVILMITAITLGMLFTPNLIRLLVPGFNSSEIDMTVYLTRIMFFQTFFMGLSGVSMGILNSYKHFVTPAVGSVLYSLSIVVVGGVLGPRIGIVAFAIGVVVGAVLNFAVQLPPLLKFGMRYKPLLNLKHPGIKQIGILVFPVLIGLSVSQFNLFVSQNLASNLPSGQLAALRTAQRFMQLPIGIFAAAISTAVFPTLTEHAARMEWGQFRRTFSLGVRTANFLAIPCVAGLIAIGLPVVRLFFEMGKFTPESTAATSIALFYYSFGIIGYSGATVLNRVFYALKDTRTPVAVGIGTVILNIILNIWLVKPMGHSGLALAYSLVGMVNMMLLILLLKKKIGSVDGKKITMSALGSSLAALVTGVVAYTVVTLLESILGTAAKTAQLISVGGGVGAGILVYFLLSYLMRLEEFQLVLDLIKRRLGMKRKASTIR